MAVIQQIARVRENDKQRSWVRDKTIAGGETYILGSQDNGCWFLKTYDIGTQSYPVKDYEVVAWRELPEPYVEVEK